MGASGEHAHLRAIEMWIVVVASAWYMHSVAMEEFALFEILWGYEDRRWLVGRLSGLRSAHDG